MPSRLVDSWLRRRDPSRGSVCHALPPNRRTGLPRGVHTAGGSACCERFEVLVEPRLTQALAGLLSRRSDARPGTVDPPQVLDEVLVEGLVLDKSGNRLAEHQHRPYGLV